MDGGRRDLGRKAEEAACAWLRRRGWSLVQRNYRCREGEIDIIARRGGLTAFCEVRARSAGCLVTPLESVGPGKQRRLVRAARRWLQEMERRGVPCGECRFDVIAVIVDEGGLKVEHVEDAFLEVD